MKPNIILINCDDLIRRLGCYGSRQPNSNADRMAAEGMRFTDLYGLARVFAIAGCHADGCYPPRIGFGAFDGRWVLFPGQGLGLNSTRSVASLLKDQGYATQIVGKWHCGDQPFCHAPRL